MIKRASWLMIISGLLLTLSLVPAATAQTGTAKVRVVHASPDAPAVDVYLDGSKVDALTNVPFFTASPYLDIPAGQHRIQVAPAGQPATAAVIDTTATVEAGKAYTVAATGKVAEIKATVFADNLSAPASGNAKVRVIHASPDAPAVDVKVAGGDALLTNLAFPNASNYLEVPAGSYNLQVTPAGGSSVVIDLPNTSLSAGTIYDVFATGDLASIKPQVVTAQPVAATTTTAPSRLPNTGGAGSSAALVGLFAALLLVGGLALRRFAR